MAEVHESTAALAASTPSEACEALADGARAALLAAVSVGPRPDLLLLREIGVCLGLRSCDDLYDLARRRGAGDTPSGGFMAVMLGGDPEATPGPGPVAEGEAALSGPGPAAPWAGLSRSESIVRAVTMPERSLAASTPLGRAMSAPACAPAAVGVQEAACSLAHRAEVLAAVSRAALVRRNGSAGALDGAPLVDGRWAETLLDADPEARGALPAGVEEQLRLVRRLTAGVTSRLEIPPAVLLGPWYAEARHAASRAKA